MKKGLVYGMVFFVVFCQGLFLYAEIASRLSHMRYSVFWNDESNESERARQHSEKAKDFINQLSNVDSLSSDYLIQKRQQAERNRMEFWSTFRRKLNSSGNPDFLTQDASQKLPQKKKLCIGVVSVDRRPQNYLTQTVSSLLEGLDEEISDQVLFFVLNTMPERSDHPEASSLSSLFPIVHEEDAHMLYPKTGRRKRMHSWNQKETLDYAFALRICEKIGRYTLILEDDLIVTSHFLQKLIHRALDPLEEAEDQNPFGSLTESQTNTLGKPWLFVRLFYSEYWSGWQGEDAPLLVVLSCLMSMVGTLIAVRAVSLIESRNFKSFVRSKPFVVFSIFLFLSLFSGLFLWGVGKQNIFTPFKNGLYPFEPAATAVGVVFPSHRTRALGDFMIAHYTREPNDILMDKYAINNQLQRLLLVPNLVQHIGAYSSNKLKNQGSYKDMKVSSTFEP